MRHLTTPALTALICLFAVGCGGKDDEEDSDNGNAALAAIDLSEDIADMSQDDLCKLNNGAVVEAYNQLSDDELCYALANTFSSFAGDDFQDACNDFFGTCQSTVSLYRVAPTTCAGATYSVSDDCDATAQEYVDCSVASISELEWAASYECTEPADFENVPESSGPSERCLEVLSCLQPEGYGTY